MADTQKQVLAERYGAVLERISQCARAVRDGDWEYLADQSRELEQAASALAMVAGQVGLPAAAADEILTLINRASGSEAATMLHPRRRGPVSLPASNASRLDQSTR